MTFLDKLNAAVETNQSLVCVGLDTSPEMIPRGMTVLDFNRAIIEATADLVCAYKPNIAFYEAQGGPGLDALRNTVAAVPEYIPVICDAKRGDIGNTSGAYARALFEHLGADAITVSPYLGHDSLEPFFAYREKFCFVLCRTSNTGAADFQSLPCQYNGETMPLYQVVARKVSQWNAGRNVGLVVGATYPEELRTVRQTHPDLAILMPGVGAQGGDLEQAVRYGVDPRKRGLIVNSARQIIYASKGPGFAAAARAAARSLRDAINRVRESIEA